MKQELKKEKIGQAIEAVLPELLEIAKGLYENRRSAEQRSKPPSCLWRGWKRMVRVDRDYWKMPFAFVLYVIPASPSGHWIFRGGMTHCRRSDTAVVII